MAVTTDPATRPYAAIQPVALWPCGPMALWPTVQVLQAMPTVHSRWGYMGYSTLINLAFKRHPLSTLAPRQIAFVRQGRNDLDFCVFMPGTECAWYWRGCGVGGSATGGFVTEESSGRSRDHPSDSIKEHSQPQGPSLTNRSNRANPQD